MVEHGGPGHRSQLRRLAARAGPNLLVSAAGPAGAFILGRHLWGLAGAVGLALTWNLAAQAGRLLSGRAWSGILLLNLIGVALRGSLALGLNSARMFFIAPAAVTAVSGLVYVVSAFTRMPLAARMLSELVPPSVADPGSARWQVLLRRGSIVYGTEQVLVACVSVLMVTRMAPTTYAAVHPAISWAVLATVAVAAIPLLRPCWRRCQAVEPSAPAVALVAPAG